MSSQSVAVSAAPGQESFEHSLASILAQSPDPSLAVLIVSLDRYSASTHLFSRADWDEMLDLAAERIQSAIRGQNPPLRLPGDEFAVILHPVRSPQEARPVAERLIDLLERAYLVRGEVVNITANIGIAFAPESGTDPAVLLARAGLALRCARSSSPAAVQLFEPVMEDRIVARQALMHDLRKALLLRQFEVHYQPQVDIATRTLTGFEALLRWRHPQLGWVSPGEFIPLAEELGLITTIGDWVLRTACQQATHLPEHIVIAVNASPLQFRTGSFLDSVDRALSHSGLSANRLEVEITESSLLQNTDAVLSTLNHLNTIGVRLAMDDFGTGYSSLGQLARLPFDTIKIDRSLMGTSPRERSIVRAVATLGVGLGMSTLAEGIETEEQLLNAHADGCTYAQGYLFGKAAPPADLEEIVARLSHEIVPMPTPLTRLA